VLIRAIANKTEYNASVIRTYKGGPNTNSTAAAYLLALSEISKIDATFLIRDDIDVVRDRIKDLILSKFLKTGGIFKRLSPDMISSVRGRLQQLRKISIETILDEELKRHFHQALKRNFAILIADAIAEEKNRPTVAHGGARRRTRRHKNSLRRTSRLLNSGR
jgi:hypothetical protein